MRISYQREENEQELEKRGEVEVTRLLKRGSKQSLGDGV